MILHLQRAVHDAVVDALRRRFSVSDAPAFAVEVPSNRTFGDLAVTVAFQLARTLKKPPRAIADDLAAALGQIPGVTRIVVAPNGYLNLYLDRPAFLLDRIVPARAARLRPPEDTEPGKTIVEHTAINPNKAAHVGHLRNATLGDTLARVLRFRNIPVEVQNYIDDTGVQVADVVVGFRELERLSLDGVRQVAESARFDHYCWDLYSRVTEWYDHDKSRLAIRAAALHDLEQGGNDVADLGAFIVDRIVHAHLQTMARLNISYDLLTYEGDILRLNFWAHAFNILKAQGAVFLQTEGKLKGCWVMRIDEATEAVRSIGDRDRFADTESMEDQAETIGATEEAHAREKVIVRSNGVVTYVGKDIANQFWKLGLLGRDFRYRQFAERADGRALWATTSNDGEPGTPVFGRARRIYNVIDSRQMYLQALLSQALRTLGHPQEAENSIHFSYEMVTLSHDTARQLGYSDVDATKRFVEVSGRKGYGVKIDDLLDLLTEKASAEVARRNPEFSAGECKRVGSQIAVGAIRYFMLKYSRGTLIVFDIEEALSFEGETGPYLQYAVVRANNIFQKLQERDHLLEAEIVASLDSSPPDEILEEPAGEGHLWALVLEASRLDDVVDQVVRSLEFSVLAKYAFGLAQLFNAFYHRYPILNEERVDRKRWRAGGVAYVRQQLTRVLDLMGIEVPVRM